MTVYVDDAGIAYGRMRMHHMFADTAEELHAMADKIGVARRWVQYPGTHKEHYDIAKGKREQAIACGAKPVTMREMVGIWRAKREATDEH